MPDISELNKLLAEALESINEESLVEKIMSKKRARKLRAARRAKLKQQVAQEKEKENDVIDAEVVDSEGDTEDNDREYKQLVVYNEKVSGGENQQKDYSDAFKKFIKEINGLVTKYGETFANAEKIWQQAGKDKPCPKEAYELYRQGLDGFKQELDTLLSTTLSQDAEKMAEEELTFIETQMMATSRFLEEYEKAITASNPQDIKLPVEVEDELQLPANPEEETSTELQVQSKTKKEPEARNWITFEQFEKMTKDPKVVWKQVTENEAELAKLSWGEFIKKNNPLSWFTEGMLGFIKSPVVRDFIKTLAYSNPLTAFIYDGKLGSLGLDGIKNSISKIGEYRDKRKAAKEKVAKDKKKGKEFYNEKGIPKDLSKLSISELRAEFYGNNHLVNLLNTAYNHPETDNNDAHELEQLSDKINKQFMKGNDFKKLEDVNRTEVVKNFTSLCTKLNEIADYQHWDNKKSFEKAKEEAEANKENRAKAVDSSKKKKENKKVKAINDLIKRYKNAKDKKYGEQEIVDAILRQYDDITSKQAQDYIDKWNKNNKHESYNTTKNLNKLLEDSRSIKENKMNLTSLDEIKQDGLTVFMPSGIQATLFLEDDNVLVQYPNLQVDKYTKKDFQNIMDEGIFIFNDMPQNFPQIMESYDLISKGSGYVEIKIPHELTYDIAQSGDNGEDVKAALKDPRIRKQFDKYDNKTIDLCFEELGIDDAEAFTREDKERFILWDLAWTLVEKEDMDESILMESRKVIYYVCLDGEQVSPEFSSDIEATRWAEQHYDIDDDRVSIEMEEFFEDEEEFEESALMESEEPELSQFLFTYQVTDLNEVTVCDPNGVEYELSVNTENRETIHDDLEEQMDLEIAPLLCDEEVEITGTEIVGFKYDEDEERGEFEFNIFYEPIDFEESLNENGLFKKELTPLPSKDASFKEGDIVTINGIKGKIIKVKPMKMSDTCTYQIKLEDGKTIWRYEEEINESLNEDNKFDYMLLARLKQDCEYFLGNGNGYEPHLWAGNVEDQIAKMKELYNKVPEKPEWLSLEDIDKYEKDMLAKRDSKNESLNEDIKTEYAIIKFLKKYGFATQEDLYNNIGAQPFVVDNTVKELLKQNKIKFDDTNGKINGWKLNEELKEEVDPSKLKIKEITKKEWDKTPNDYKLEKDGQKYIMYLDDETQATVLGLCKIIDESLNEDANSIATELRNGNKSGTDKELGQWKLKTSLDSNWENLTELVKTLILFNIADEVENGNLEMKDFAQYFDNSMDLTKEDLQSLDMFTDEEIDTMFSTNGYLECFITYEIQHLEDPSEDIEESLIDKLSKKGIIRESLVKKFKENNFQAYDKSWYVIGMDGEQAGPFDCYQEAEEYIEEVTGGDEQLRADYSVISADEMEESLNEEDEIKYYWGKTDQNKTLLVAGKSSEDAITNSKKFFTPELVFNSPEECDKEYDEIIDLKENIEEEKTLDFLGINQNDFTSKEELIKYIEENTDYDVLSSGDYWLNIIDRTQNDGEAIQINLERKMREAYEKTKRKEGDVFKALKNKKKEYLTPEFKTELLNSLDRIAREFPNVKVRQQAVTFMDELGLQEYYDTKKIKDFIKKNLEVLNAKVNESLDEGKKQEQFKEKDKKKKKKKLDELNKEVNKMEELKEDCYKVYNSIENRECGTFNSWNEVEDFLNKEWGDYKASMAKENPEFGTDDDKYNFFGNYDMVTTQLPVAVVPAEIEVDVEATPEPVAEPLPEEPVIPQVCPDCGNEPCSCELCVEEPENCDGCADIEVPEDAEEIDMDAIIDEMCMTKLPDPKKVLDKDGKQEKKNKEEEDKNEDFKDNMGMLTDINDLDFPDALQNAVDTKEDGSLYRISDVAKMVSELKAEIDSLKSEFKTALDELKQGIKDDVKDIRTDVTSKLDNTDDKISELTAEEEDLEALEEPIEEEPTEESAEETEEPAEEENTEDEELEEALKEMRKNPIYSQIKETFESNAHPKKLISVATVAQKIRENYGTDIKNDFTYELIKSICTMAPEFKEHVVDAETEKRTLKESMLGKAAKWISGGLMGILAQEKENKNMALIESYKKEAAEKAEKQNEDANEIKKEIDKLNAEGKNDKIKATIDVMSDTPEEKEEAIDYAIQKVQESNANDLLRRLKNTSRTAAFSNLNIKG